MKKYKRISVLRPGDPLAAQLDGIFERKHREEAASIALSGRYDGKFPPTFPRGAEVTSLIQNMGDTIAGIRGDKYLVVNRNPGARWRYIIYKEVRENPFSGKNIAKTAMDMATGRMPEGLVTDAFRNAVNESENEGKLNIL